jgi:hypothetical protein
VSKIFKPDHVLTMHASHQSTDFEATGIVTGQNFSFFDIRSEYSARFSKRLSLQVYHQYFATSTVSEVQIPADVSASKASRGLFAPAIVSLPIADVAPAVSAGRVDSPGPLSSAAVPGGWTGMFRPASAPANLTVPPDATPTVEVDVHSSTIGAQLSYVLFPSLSVGGGVSASTITPLEGPVIGLFEQATRLFDTQANVSWGRRLGLVSARANATYGVSNSRSNLGDTGSAPFYSASGGVSVGNPNRLVVYADANYLYREDVYMTNGFAEEVAYSGGLEAQLLPSLHFTGSAGVSTFDEVSPDGREHYRRTLYAFGLEHRIVTFQFSKTTNDGNRDVFSVPFDTGIGRLFYLLPIDTLVPDPLGRTSSRFTQAVLRFRLVRDLDLEARYINNDSEFVAAQDVAGRQLEVLATYHLGRFTFRAGALLERLAIEAAPVQRRTQYFFRVSRSFRIL